MTWDQPILRRGQASFGSRESWAQNVYPGRITYFHSAATGLDLPNSHSCSQPPTSRQVLFPPSLGRPWNGSLLLLSAGLYTYPLEPLGITLPYTHTHTREHTVCTGMPHLHPGLKARLPDAVLSLLEQHLALNKHLINVCHNHCLLQSVEKGNRNWELSWSQPRPG